MVKKPFQDLGTGLLSEVPDSSWAHVEVQGTGPPVKNALKRGGWNGKLAIAAVMVTVEKGAISGSEWILRGALSDISVPMKRLSGDHKMAVTLNLGDLSDFKFPSAANPGTGAPNYSVWCNGEDMTTSLTAGGITLTEASAIKSSAFMKDIGFSLR